VTIAGVLVLVWLLQREPAQPVVVECVPVVIDQR